MFLKKENKNIVISVRKVQKFKKKLNNTVCDNLIYYYCLLFLILLLEDNYKHIINIDYKFVFLVVNIL